MNILKFLKFEIVEYKKLDSNKSIFKNPHHSEINLTALNFQMYTVLHLKMILTVIHFFEYNLKFSNLIEIFRTY